MALTRIAAQYLEELRRITAELAGSQRLDEVLDAIARGLRKTGHLGSASMLLYLRDEDCPVCRAEQRSATHAGPRLHRVAFDADPFREAPPEYHAFELGYYLSGKAAQDGRAMLFPDVLHALRTLAHAGPDGPGVEELITHLQRLGLTAAAYFPLLAGPRLIGVVAAYARAPIAPEEAGFLEVFALQIATLIQNAQMFDQLEALKERLRQENDYLELAVREEAGFRGIIGQSRAMRRVLTMVRQVAPTDTTVLLTGETGTGKELVARAIHDASPRAAHPLIKVNCGAIPPGLADSEFFGHERGAFTGAQQRRIGRFELADGGTIFLDEVGELGLETQVRLLRVLQERELERVGGERSIRIDVRVLAATNRDLASDVRDGRFRSDLYYRLNVLHIRVPALRERREDIPALASHFATQVSRRLGRSFVGLSARSLDRLTRYDWPGNIRELQNVIERACVLSAGPMIDIRDVGDAAAAHDVLPAEAALELDAVERQHLLRVLDRTEGRIEGVGGAAELLGLKPSTLRSRMRKLGIGRRTRREGSASIAQPSRAGAGSAPSSAVADARPHRGESPRGGTARSH